MILFVLIIAWISLRIYKYPTYDDINSWERFDLATILACVVDLKNRGAIEFVETNINSKKFSNLFEEHCKKFFDFEVFSITSEGIIDSRGMHVIIMAFNGEDFDDETQNLANQYQVAAWTIGENKVNEFGRGDDNFVGLRRDGGMDYNAGGDDWWKFWK